jgi:hypothetical protein
MKKIPKDKLWDYFILVARVWLALILLKYGYSKLIAGQFGVNKATLEMPLKSVGLFNLSWYLADHEPFKSFIGISQIMVAFLLLFNRTVILGAFISIPIWINILMWDMTFMGLYTPFTIRITFYLLLTLLILWHYREKVVPAIQSLISGTTTKFNYPIWAYLLLPIFGFFLELLGGMPSAFIYLIKQLSK